MRREKGRARTVNGATLRRTPSASSAVRGFAHRLHRATEQPHAERRRLGGHRDSCPGEILHTAMLAAGSRRCLGLGCRRISRLSGRALSRRSRSARRRPRGGAGPPAGGFRADAGGGRVAGVATARASHPWPARGEVAEHASLPGGVLGSLRLRWALLLVGHLSAYSIVPDGRMRGAERRNCGPSTVLMGEPPARGAGLGAAGIDAASRVFPAHKRGNT